MIRSVLTAGACLLAGLSVPAAFGAPAQILVDAVNVFPESITSTPDGALITGSATRPVIYRAAPGAAFAEPWITMTGGGDASLGVLADPASHTLWVCALEIPPALPAKPGAPAAMQIPRHTILRSFDLRSGKAKASYPLPGDANACNDASVGPGRVLYVADTANGRVLRLKPGAAALENWLDNKELLAGVDGIAFLGRTLYVNTVSTGHIYRIPINADGSAGAPVDIKLSQPLQGPDGMRAAGGHIYVAENRAGQISQLTFQGDSATVTVLKTGYKTPTAVAFVGRTIWVGESKFAYRRDPSLGDANPFSLYALAMPK